MTDLNTPLTELLPGVRHRAGQRVGIELEYEGFSNTRFIESNTKVTKWYLERDPSLRAGGMELISSILQPGYVKGALEEAHAIVKASKARAHLRCGVHVHLNMTDVTLKHLWNTIVLYTLAEPSIFKEFADGREGSHFCVPLWSNAVFAQAMYTDIKTIRGGSMPTQRPKKRARRDLYGDLAFAPAEPQRLGLFRCIKYSALNFKPLTTLGTIEFRQHPATTDMGRVRKWVDFLMHMRDVAGEYNDPLDILDQYEDIGIAGLRDNLGLEHLDVDDLDQEEAEDVATMAAGHIPAPWTDFTWEIK